MPIRRPSASGPHGSSHHTSGASRGHRSNDSHHNVAVAGPAQPPSIAYSAASATPQQKIVQALINRLKNKLPCNSGLPLNYIEADNPTVRAVEALVQLSHDCLDIIAWSLSELLERLAKQTDANGNLGIDVLQSQLFVMKVLSFVLAARWNADKEEAMASSRLDKNTTGPEPLPSKQKPGTSVSPSQFMEPSPLDENCARYILSVMVLYLRQTAPPETRLMSSAILSLDSSFYDFESVDVPTFSPALEVYCHDNNDIDPSTPHSTEPTLHSKPSTNTVNSGATDASSSIPMMPLSFHFDRTHMSLAKSSLSLNNHIGKYAGRIIYHLSASNWQAIFDRIRSRVNTLSSTSGDNPDTVDLQLMGCSAMDRSRLVQVLQVLSSLLVNMKRDAQAAVARPLRRAIWNWIDLFPGEFNETLLSRGRMEGTPQRTFDLLYEQQSSAEKGLWPALTILNCISSERIGSDFQINHFGSGHFGGQKGSHRKEHRFIEELIKNANTPSKFSDAALACLLDMCRVAFHIPPESETTLRVIGSDIAHEIKVALQKTHQGKPFWLSRDEIDVGLYAEALATVFRYLPEEESIPMFVTCLEAERSEAVKIAVARAGLMLALEAPRLPWQKPLLNLIQATTSRFREVYKAAAARRHEQDQYGNDKKAASRPKARRYASDTLSDRELLFLSFLAMWRSDPRFLLFGFIKSDIVQWVPAVSKIWEAPLDVSVKISASTNMHLICEAVFQMIPSDAGFDSIVTWVERGAPLVLGIVATNLLRARNDPDAQRLWMGDVHSILSLYPRKSEKPHVKIMQLCPDRVPAFAISEIAVLVSLMSADKSLAHLAAQCLRLIAQAERQADAPVNSGMSLEERSRRYPVYERMGDPNVVVVGRVEQQKRTRKFLRSIAHPTPTNIAVWLECYWRWRSLCEFVVQSPLDPMSSEGWSLSFEEKHVQWKNLTLFLAAFGGVCVQESYDPSALISVIPAQHLPDELRAQDPMAMVSTFINDLTDLLITESAQVREVARDALGNELSPRLYGKLFRHLEEVTRDVTDGANLELPESFGIFLDQFTAVLKLLLEKPDIPAEEVENIDISICLVALAGFMARFVNPSSYRIRLKLCALCECACARTGTLTLRRDTSARQKIIDILMEWIQDPSSSAGANSTNDQCNLNMACLRTSVKLLENLELKTYDSSMGDESGHVVSRLYLRYSTMLLKGLDFCQDASSSDSVSDIPSLQKKMRISQREADIRDLVVAGLSHLVNSNTEAGFKHCLPLAYESEVRKRTIFARVFSRVLKQGTKFEPPETSTIAKSSLLCQLVKKPDMLLALAICEICPSSDVDVIISVLMNLYDTRTSLVNLLKLMIDREIAHTENDAALFRSNSTTTRFLSAFAKIHGYNYLRSLILPLIQAMTSLPPEHGFDLDPSKAAGQDVEQNQQNVQTVTTAFLRVISSSAPTIPPMFREICAHIARSVQEVWPEAKFAALGAFIFLRFISPAIVSPEVVDVEIPRDDGGRMRRGLMVIAKVVQNLANNIFFGKEAHMVCLNEYLRKNIVIVTRYLSEVNKHSAAAAAAAADDDSDEWLGTTADDTDTIVLHRFFSKYNDKIGKELLSQAKPVNEDDSVAMEGREAWASLCTALVDIGDPLDVPQLSRLPRSEHEGYIDLMTRYTHQNSDSIQEIFVETLMQQDQPAIFVLRVSKIDVESLDIELFMFHIFKILELPIYDNRDFEIILDCTSYTSMSDIPVQWLKYCMELIPSDIRQRYLTTYILNPNALTQKYLRRLYNISAGIPFSSGIRAYSSVEELLEHVPAACAESLSYAASLEDERREVFTEATMRQSHQMRMPVTLEVGVSHIRITSIKAQPLSPSLACKSTEIISLRDVSDIYNVSTGHDPYEFIIRRSRQGVTLYFSSPMRETIVKTIRTAKSQMRDGQRALMERALGFTSVSATLLHVGFLGIDHEDEELRGAAYDLLGAVCTHLGYDKHPIIASEAGFIPDDPSTFVVNLSDRLAHFAPHLTLDFITEVSSRMEKATPTQRINCLQCLGPWIPNLAKYCDPASPLYEHSGARLRDAIRLLVDLTTSDYGILSIVQKYVWAKIGQLDTSIVNVVLDELMRSAIDGGVGSRRCEVIARTVAALSSINVRGRIFSKLRKILGRTSMKPTKTLVDNAQWAEIAALTRLAFVAGNHSKQAIHTQLYIPEIVHLVTLTAGIGPTFVRKSVYGIVLNYLQSLYSARSDDEEFSEVFLLIEEFTQPAILSLFGLARTSATSEYTDLNPANDNVFLETQEGLTKLLIRVMETTAGTKGLLNVWRARWMGLVTSLAFQHSPAIQSRAFIALGMLATSDVDDDLLYQMLVAFKTALAQSNETDTTSVVCMLRCISKIVTALPSSSKYFSQLFWLAVALLQASHFAFYVQAADLLRQTLEKLHTHAAFHEMSVAEFLLKGRIHLEETLGQLDQLLGLSFETSFSFSLVSVIFKGIRHSSLRDAAEGVLRSLLRVTVEANQQAGSTTEGTLLPDALGYFLALIPLSTRPKAYERLLQECQVSGFEITQEITVPRISLDFIGLDDANAALLMTSFVGAMLMTAQGDDAETQMLYTLLADLATIFPDVVSMAYDILQDKIKDTFANSSNPNVIKAVSSIFRVALQDPIRLGALRGSASTLGTVDEATHGPGKYHLLALEDLNMRGLASNFQFLPVNRGHATKMITWIPELVLKIVEA